MQCQDIEIYKDTHTHKMRCWDYKENDQMNQFYQLYQFKTSIPDSIYRTNIY